MSWRRGIQTLVDTLYPATCLSCENTIEDTVGLCGACWRAAPFIAGLVCETCGQPLMGTSHSKELCDECLAHTKPWAAARGVFLYEGKARKLVWDLKYADRADVAKAAGKWLLNAAQDILSDDPLVIPVPLHWTRLLKRKYNQSELLARALSDQGGFEEAPNALKRIRRTPTLVGLDRSERELCLKGAIIPSVKHSARLTGRHILLVDDVMTTGATLGEAANACKQAGALTVSAVFLARAAKND